jgi:DNA replication regulator SLD3
MGSQPMVLIARLDDGRTLCAVERESRGLYALCQLGSWVNLQGLKAAAVVSKQELHKLSERAFPASAVAQAAATAPLATPESSKYSKKKRLAIEAIQSMVKRPSTALATESQESPVDLESTTNVTEKAVVPPQEEVNAQLTAAEIFENVRTQYFETLYLSKAGLVLEFISPLLSL